MNDDNSPKSKSRNVIGFTLVFLSLFPFYYMIPGEILADLSNPNRHDLRPKDAAYDLLRIHSSLQYKILNRSFPTTEQGLAALVTPPASASKQKRIVESSGILDPWGNPYQYQTPGKSGRPYHIWSFGPDGKNGTEDDVHYEQRRSL